MIALSSQRRTAPPSAPEAEGVARFEATVHDSGEWRARLENLGLVLGQGPTGKMTIDRGRESAETLKELP